MNKTKLAAAGISSTFLNTLLYTTIVFCVAVYMRGTLTYNFQYTTCVCVYNSNDFLSSDRHLHDKVLYPG